MKIVLPLFASLVSVAAQAAVYKCGEGTQVVFTDRPCIYAQPAEKAGARPVPARPEVVASRLPVSNREASASRPPLR